MDTLFILAVVAVIIVLLFDYTNGFHDAANIDREDIYRAITARNVEHSRRTLVQQTGNNFWLNMRAAPSSRDRSVNAGRTGQQSLAWQ